MRFPQKKKRRATSALRGGALVEFVIIAPVAILLALGCLDLGRVFYDQATVSYAARQGAFQGCFTNFDELDRAAWESRIRESVVEEMRSLRYFDETDMDLEISILETDEEDFKIKVEVSYPFKPIFTHKLIEIDLHLKHHVIAKRYR